MLIATSMPPAVAVANAVGEAAATVGTTTVGTITVGATATVGVSGRLPPTINCVLAVLSAGLASPASITVTAAVWRLDNATVGVAVTTILGKVIPETIGKTPV
ncbi:hypothetical protein KDI_42860 [Dictyobacter arantiisoli]|uniref:Uncharacterized protein n=1 Tax=Dictyobacter arantiisoli TaxID=2014874 RepID=A0A5A5THD4_9CHLR|nr:hypothetical protein KDI_42860 [Dictyobacter arantiisoli]